VRHKGASGILWHYAGKCENRYPDKELAIMFLTFDKLFFLLAISTLGHSLK